MSSTVLLSKGAGQIYILAVMAEAAVVDDDVPPLTVAVFRLCTYPKADSYFFIYKKNKSSIFEINRARDVRLTSQWTVFQK